MPATIRFRIFCVPAWYYKCEEYNKRNHNFPVSHTDGKIYIESFRKRGAKTKVWV